MSNATPFHDERGVEALRERGLDGVDDIDLEAALGAIVADPASHRREEILQRTIESEIIPRLLIMSRGSLAAHAVAAPAGCVPPAAIDEADVAGFISELRRGDLQRCVARVRAHLARGVSTERVFLDLLSCSARRLGEMWVEDECSFGDVSLGVVRLQQVMRLLAPPPPVAGNESGNRVLLVPFPGDRHVFGIAMVEEFFRDAGWHVTTATVSAASEIAPIVAAEEFAAIGFSLAREELLGALRDTIAAVRRASCNPDLVVLVGGRLFSERPELCAEVGADATGADARQAVIEARSLLGLLAGR